MPFYSKKISKFNQLKNRYNKMDRKFEVHAI